MSGLPLDKLLERFLEQSADAEDHFYKMEEQRLQQEERRREAEHARELHMLHVLGQIFGGIAGSRGGVPSTVAAAAAAVNVSATPMQSAPSPAPTSVHVAPASSSWSQVRSQHARQQHHQQLQRGALSPLGHHLPDHGLESVPGLLQGF